MMALREANMDMTGNSKMEESVRRTEVYRVKY
jgi:hypothetical protein